MNLKTICTTLNTDQANSCLARASSSLSMTTRSLIWRTAKSSKISLVTKMDSKTLRRLPSSRLTQTSVTCLGVIQLLHTTREFSMSTCRTRVPLSCSKYLMMDMFIALVSSLQNLSTSFLNVGPRCLHIRQCSTGFSICRVRFKFSLFLL